MNSLNPLTADQRDYINRQSDLEAEIAEAERQLRAAKEIVPARPIPPKDNVIEAVNILEAHCTKLKLRGSVVILKQTATEQCLAIKAAEAAKKQKRN